MTPADWERVKTIVADALEAPQDTRAAFVAGACQDDPALRAEVESLLTSYAGLGDFIEEPPTAAVASAIDATQSPLPDRIGAYRVESVLGHGGMGTVYLAERVDDEYRTKAAIKVMKRGMDSDEIVRRFRAERQVLARLDHPNIVRLLDGGTTDDGLPYFVMEHVVGVPIDEYCRTRSLSLRERLELFGRVLPAVQFAHRNLVVHRDLKPSNILVTSDGRPRLLDFGIAKVLDPAEDGHSMWQTVASLRPMTPDYASPEQVRGEAVTTASDVYSLGVLLYELLTSMRPYALKGRGLDEIEREIGTAKLKLPSAVVTELQGRTPDSLWTGPETPERTRRQLVGDLDTIVVTAMHADPARRYASVDALGEDLRRYLESLPIAARPDSVMYRVTKFVGRHRAAVTAAGFVVLASAAGVSAVVWQARVASAQREIAVRRFDDVRQLANSYLYELHDAIASLPGSTAARALVVMRALEYLDRLSPGAGDDPALQAELAAAYAKAGDVQWHRYYSHLGNASGALESQRKAMAIRQKLLAEEPANLAKKLDVAGSHVLLGDVLIATGALTEAIAHYQSSLALRSEVAAARPDDARVRNAVAVSHQRLGDNLGNPAFANIGDVAGSLVHYDAMQRAFQAAADENPGDLAARHSLSIGFEKIGDVERGAGRIPAARERYVDGLKIREALVAADPVNGRYRRDLAVAHGKVGFMSELMGDLADARTQYQAALDLRRLHAKTDPSDAGARFDVATAYRQLGNLEASEARRSVAAGHFRTALGLARDLAAGDPANTEFKALVESLTERLAQTTNGR